MRWKNKYNFDAILARKLRFWTITEIKEGNSNNRRREKTVCGNDLLSIRVKCIKFHAHAVFGINLNLHLKVNHKYRREIVHFDCWITLHVSCVFVCVSVCARILVHTAGVHGVLF